MGIFVAIETYCAIQIVVIFTNRIVFGPLNMCANLRSIGDNLTIKNKNFIKSLQFIDFAYQND